MYKQIINPFTKQLDNLIVLYFGENTSFIPFGLANTDYQRFKQEINADEAQLQDVDGNVMSVDAAKEFVAGLP